MTRPPAARRVRKSLTLLVIPVAASLVVAGCSKTGTSTGSKATVAAQGAVSLDTASCPADASKALAAGADIVIGASTAMSGPAASASVVLAGVNAYFDRVNDRGGVDGHKIKLDAKDDGFDTSRQVTNVTAMIQQDHVFATLGDLGTAQTTATQPIQEKNCVPQLYVSSGAPNFYDPAGHPWSTSGFLPYASWGQAVAQYLKKQYPSGA
ncbi:MAG: ABC transporter substrate-binding protein, partial [Allobranchiibius sp.]